MEPECAVETVSFFWCEHFFSVTGRDWGDFVGVDNTTFEEIDFLVTVIVAHSFGYKIVIMVEPDAIEGVWIALPLVLEVMDGKDSFAGGESFFFEYVLVEWANSGGVPIVVVNDIDRFISGSVPFV